MSGRFSDKVINWIGFTYLRSLSLRNTTEIVRSFYERDCFSKDTVLTHLEFLIDQLPSISEITRIFRPSRSGYYAFDGMWFKYRGEDRVLLICFDTATLDVVNYFIARKEDYYTWGRLLEIVDSSEADLLERAKGFYSDGKLGLVKQLRKKYSYVPLQLCVFHKYARSGQIVPFVRAKGEDERIKSMVEEVLFASSRENAVAALDDLRRYAREHQQTKKVKQIVGVLNRNFQLLLTHFDHPEMSPYNNALEGFNHILKRRIRLMKGFKKDLNLDRWIKFMLLDYRFHKINSSKFPDRNQKSPLELAGCDLPKYHNWITLVRKKAGK